MVGASAFVFGCSYIQYYYSVLITADPYCQRNDNSQWLLVDLFCVMEIQNQTNLTLVKNGADLTYEGEIVSYRVTPMTATADQQASQNRLTIRINVRFINKKTEKDDFEKTFEFFYDYPATTQLTGTTLSAALTEIFDRITQDVFNASLAKW